MLKRKQAIWLGGLVLCAGVATVLLSFGVADPGIQAQLEKARVLLQKTEAAVKTLRVLEATVEKGRVACVAEKRTEAEQQLLLIENRLQALRDAGRKRDPELASHEFQVITSSAEVTERLEHDASTCAVVDAAL